MSLAQRLHRLEERELERRLRDVGERLAVEFGVPVEETVRDLREVAARVDRWGIDAELRRMAADLGLSEDEVRARYEAEVAELEGAAHEVTEL